MPDDGSDSWWRRVWSVGADASRRPAGDAPAKESVAELSRRLGERAARQAATDPADAARARRAALEAWDRARARRLKVMAGCTASVLAVAGLAGLVVAKGWPPVTPSVGAEAPGEARAEAPTEPPPISLAAIALETESSQPPSPSEPVVSSPTARAPGAPAVETAPPAPLMPEEVREVQARLLGFGFNPGVADGAVGRLTTAAATRYQQERALEQTGKVDRALLEQLRQDQGAQVAQAAKPPLAKPRAAQPDSRASRRTARRDPGPIPTLGRWLDSLTR